MFDLEGCGLEKLGREGVERKVQENLTVNGWENRCAVVAIEPELESWVWDGSLRVASVLKWEKQRLQDWLLQKRFLPTPSAVKPKDPKGAYEQAMRAARVQKSSSVFQDLARSAGVTDCTDTAFRKFLVTLQSWFPPSRQ